MVRNQLSAKPRQPFDRVADRYVLVRKLGEGAAGVVWIARSTALDVDVALKMLKPELAGTPAVERMEREARTAAQLGHPALVRVLDFGISELGEPFLALELLEGEELQAHLAREQRLPAKEAISLLLPIIDGLGTAHNQGIIHRDVKPENIFIARDHLGRIQPKMLDFGIAKLHDAASHKLTQAGAVVGSPYYLSPEQARGAEDIDFRTDVWSIGVVLYELITGAPPFSGANYNALVASILRDAPRPFVGEGDADAALWTVVECCLRKNREQRWASMWELGQALALWLFERGVRVDAAARSLRHGWLSGTATGVEILLPSHAPEMPSLPPRSRAGHLAAATTSSESSSTLPAPAAPAPVSARSPWRWALGGLALSGLAFGGFELLRSPGPASPSAAGSALAQQLEPSPSHERAAASAAPTPTPTAEAVASTSPSAAPSPASSAVNAQTSRATGPRPPAPKRSRSKHEFGF